MKELNEDRIKVASYLINLIYECDHGGAGGFGHSVFDDGNIEDDSIDFCLKGCEDVSDNVLTEELRLLSAIALNFFKTLTTEERQIVYETHDQYIP